MTTAPTLPLPPADLLDGASLFLDFDGTLVEIAPRPDAVEVSDRLHHLLTRLASQMPGRLAVISGRSIAQIEGFLGPLPIHISGSHGLEIRRADGSTQVPTRPPSLDRIFQRFHEEAALRPGLIVEEKPFSAALHYRLVPDAEQAVQTLVRDLANETGLHIQPGKMMVELRPAGSDKGMALRTLMEQAPMTGTRPVFVGDDDTDEPAMAAAADLGGAGILVGTPRQTEARYGLDGVAAVLDWLEAALLPA